MRITEAQLRKVIRENILKEMTEAEKDNQKLSTFNVSQLKPIIKNPSNDKEKNTFEIIKKFKNEFIEFIKLLSDSSKQKFSSQKGYISYGLHSGYTLRIPDMNDGIKSFPLHFNRPVMSAITELTGIEFPAPNKVSYSARAQEKSVSKKPEFQAGVPAGLQGLKEAIRRIILQELRKR